MENNSVLIRDIRDFTAQKTLSHDEIVNGIIQQLQKIDFHSKKNPDVLKWRKELEETDPADPKYQTLQGNIARVRLNQTDFRVLSIEEILSKAIQNNWGICFYNNSSFLYNGQYWKEIRSERLQQFLGESCERMGVDSITSKDYKFREQLEKQFFSSSFMEAPKSTKVLVNLRNGTFEISEEFTGLRSFDSEDFLTYQLPFEFIESADCLKWKMFLNDVLPDIDAQKVLSEYLGYLFIRNGSGLKLEKALVLYGTGQNGKSVVYDVIKAIVGEENISHYTLQDLTNDKGHERAEIGTKILNYASEISDKMNPAIFKALASGEEVGARRLYSNPFTLRNYAKLIFNCNVLPKTNEQTDGYFRRLMIIPFNVKISEEQKNINLASEIISEESAGVFNWILEGLKRLKHQGAFTKSSLIDNMVQTFRKESDTVTLFLDDSNYSKDNNSKSYSRELYQEYQRYSIESGFKHVGKSEFNRRMENLSHIKHRDSIGYYFNISTKSADIDDMFNPPAEPLPF